MTDLPTVIGRYQVRRELGRGMMGVVYEAHDPDLGRDIALKVIQLPAGIGADERQNFEQRFFAEARTAARLSHAGILVVHDVGRDARTGALFMALELLEGETLESLLKRGALPWREALRVAQRVAEALHYAHSQRVVHRDIKPANLMILTSGEPKIMDFGIAKLETSQLTATGQFLGTPLYMSPEQALAHPIDGRSDLFSLGSVLYEMLTGRKAFAGENVTKILFQIMSREPDPPSRVTTGLPEAVDYVLARCLAKDVTRRYRDGLTLSEDLEDLLAARAPRGRGVWQAPVAGSGTVVALAPQPSAPPPQPALAKVPARTPPAASRWPRSALAGTLALLLLAGGWLALRVLRPPVARLVATPTTTEASDGSGDHPAAESLDTSPATRNEAPAPRNATRLLVDFEHSLKSGVLRVWVDDHPVVEQPFEGRVTRRVGGLEMRKGRVSNTLEVAPGRREVRVQVTWEDNVKTESAWATFKAGATMRLQARLGSFGGIRKDLSLDWD